MYFCRSVSHCFALNCFEIGSYVASEIVWKLSTTFVQGEKIVVFVCVRFDGNLQHFNFNWSKKILTISWNNRQIILQKIGQNSILGIFQFCLVFQSSKSANFTLFYTSPNFSQILQKSCFESSSNSLSPSHFFSSLIKNHILNKCISNCLPEAHQQVSFHKRFLHNHDL